MSKYKKVPWEANMSTVRDNVGYPIARTLPDERIPMPESIAQMKTYARLIAASPTMYEYISKLANLGDTDAIEIISKATQ